MYKIIPANSIECLVTSTVDVIVQETYPTYYCSFNVITVSVAGTAGRLMVSTVFSNYSVFEGLIFFYSNGHVKDAGDTLLTTYSSSDLITSAIYNDMRIHMFKNRVEFYVSPSPLSTSTVYNLLFRFQTAGDKVANISYGLFGQGPTGITGTTGGTGPTGPTGPNISSDITYTPTTITDWTGTAPTTVSAALDRIAAALVVLNVYP
jgi:hypothetical protein